jgi:hypothetical protein
VIESLSGGILSRVAIGARGARWADGVAEVAALWPRTWKTLVFLLGFGGFRMVELIRVRCVGHGHMAACGVAGRCGRVLARGFCSRRAEGRVRVFSLVSGRFFAVRTVDVDALAVGMLLAVPVDSRRYYRWLVLPSMWHL